MAIIKQSINGTTWKEIELQICENEMRILGILIFPKFSREQTCECEYHCGLGIPPYSKNRLRMEQKRQKNTKWWLFIVKQINRAFV